MTNSDTTDKVIDLASKKMDELGTQLSALAHQYGPDVVQAALVVARIDAAENIVRYIIFLGIILAIGSTIKPFWTWAAKYSDDYDAATYVLPLVIIASTLILTIVLICNFSIWPLVGVYEPKLWIAHKLLNLG